MAIKGKNESIIIFPPFIVNLIYEFRKIDLNGDEIISLANTIDSLMQLWQDGHVDENGKVIKKVTSKSRFKEFA